MNRPNRVCDVERATKHVVPQEKSSAASTRTVLHGVHSRGDDLSLRSEGAEKLECEWQAAGASV